MIVTVYIANNVEFVKII